MNIENYIRENIFSYKEHFLTKQEEKELNKKALPLFILSKLISTKFRRRIIGDDEKSNILKKINNFIEKKEPIKITLCFGGYKQNWSDDFPGVGWAEIFHISFILKYVSIISTLYKPGVILEWESEDVILEHADNYKKSDLDVYIKEFRELLNYYANFLPDNIKLNLIRSREQYDENILLKKMSLVKGIKLKELKNLDEKELEKTISRAGRNFLWNGKENLTRLSEDEKHEKVLESKAMNLAFLDVDYELREKYFEEEVIPIVFSFGIDKENAGDWLTISSTSSSFCDFWVGLGVLEIRENGRIIERILSKQQFEKIENKLKKVNLNFEEEFIVNNIYIYEGALSF